MADLERFNEVLGRIDDVLSAIAKHSLTVEPALKCFREFREAVEAASLAEFPDNELQEIERALKILLEIEGPDNLYAKRALDKIQDRLSVPVGVGS